MKRLCPKYCVNEKTGFRYNPLYLDSVFKYGHKLVHQNLQNAPSNLEG